MTSILAMCLMANAACGYSPLLNHTHPVRTPVSAAVEGEATPACRFQFQNGALCADFVWIKEPSGGGDEGSAKIYFWVKALPGAYSSPLFMNVDVKLWMPDMGHGSQKVKVQQAKYPNGQSMSGVYDATEVMFVMGGEWEIQLQLKDAATGKLIESQKINYRVR